MKLEEAIEHLEEELKIKEDWSCVACKEDHEQLLSWLKELQAIKNTNSNEALKCLDLLGDFEWHNKPFKECFLDLFDTIKNYILKAQEQEKENDILKEIIKSLFDRGCPLHQYVDKDWGLTIEVDDECSIMHLGKYKGVDLDEKLKEVLKNE